MGVVVAFALVFLGLVNNGMSDGVNRPLFCQSKIDLAFVIDSSSSISEIDFELQKHFVMDIVKLLDVGIDKTRVSAISFGDRIFPEFALNKYNTKQEVLGAIENIRHYFGTSTRTYRALNFVNHVMFQPENGDRADVMDVVIVLTDGVTNPGNDTNHWSESAKNQTQIEAAMIKARSAVMFAIGVGSKVDINELNGISSDPDERFTILVSSFGQLNSKDVKQMLLDRTCSVTPTAVPLISSPKPTTEPCSKTKAADIFFIVDESSSLYVDSNFREELDFAQSVISEYELGPSKVRVGLMTFATSPRILFHLRDFKTKSEIATLLEKTPWEGGSTYLDRAFTLLMDEGMTQSFGSRADVPHIVVVITDGKSTDPQKTNKTIEELREKKYIVFAIGVGPELDPAELAIIASDPSHVFQVKNLDRLWTIRKNVVTKLCPGTQPGTPEPITICKGAKADVIFVADSSSSIGHIGFANLTRFAKSVVRRITSETNDIQVGLITFSDEAQFRFRLNTYSSDDEIMKAIDNVPWSTGNTNTHKALELLNNYGFKTGYGGRDDVPHIAIIITDGTSREPQKTKQLTVKLHKQGIVIFSIGVGQYIDQQELDFMASKPTSKHSFYADSFGALSSIEESLANKTCTVKRRPLPS